MSFKQALIITTVIMNSSLVAFAQNGVIKGRVTDDQGMAAAGVTVYYKDTPVATTTDANGLYTIEAIKGRELVFSLLGMKEERIQIGDKFNINVALQSQNLSLDDVVVIGYGTEKRADLTGAVSSIKAEEIAKSGSNSALGALQGKIPGFNITSRSGEPGSGFDIKIRGNNSINAATTPLFVIDGMPMNVSSDEVASSSATGSATYDPLSFINPNDIESVEVLKDASATAIYGANGANGVVVITTKSGAKGYDKTLVDFSATFGLSQVPKYIQMLGAQDYMSYRFYRKDSDYGQFGYDSDGDGVRDSPQDASSYEYHDWQKELYRTAMSQTYNLSLTAKIKNTQIAAGLGYLDQEGLVRNNSYNRYSGRMKVDHEINNRVKTGATMTFARTRSSGAVTSGGGSLNYDGLVQYIYLERPINKWSENEPEFNYAKFDLNTLVNEESFRKSVYDRFNANAYLDWKIIDKLTLSINANGGTSNSNTLEYFSSNSKWGFGKKGQVSDNNSDTYYYNASARLNYNKQWGKGHNVKLMAGGEYNYYNISKLNLTGYNFTDESTGAYNIGKAGVLMSPSQNMEENAKLSFFSRATYNFWSKYYVAFNFRADGSSRFSDGNRVGYFPSLSAAWRINKERWFKNKDIDNLKIRLSAGASGNDRIGNYASLATIRQNYYAADGTEVMGMAATGSANPNLKWETTYQYDAGIDFSIFKERIRLTADVYYKDTRDMLYQATLPAQTGYTLQWQNLGRVDNKGVEIALNTRNIDRKNFYWTTDFTFYLNRNRVLDIGDIQYTMVSIPYGQLSTDISRIVVGEPIGIGWGYLADGNYQLDDFVIKNSGGRVVDSSEITSENINDYTYTLKADRVTITGVSVQPGDRKYKDLDGNNTITTADRQKISDSNPKFTAGLGNTLGYKNFNLSFFFEGVYGRSILNEFKLRSESGKGGGTANSNITKASWDGRWTPENPSNTYSRLLNETNTWCSSYYVEDGSFLRLKNVSVSYNFNKKILLHSKIRSAKISFMVDNTFVLTSYSGMDPDVSSSNNLFTGFDRMSYPKARTYSFTLNLGF